MRDTYYQVQLTQKDQRLVSKEEETKKNQLN